MYMYMYLIAFVNCMCTSYIVNEHEVMKMKWKHSSRIDKKVIIKLYKITENFLH